MVHDVRAPEQVHLVREAVPPVVEEVDADERNSPRPGAVKGDDAEAREDERVDRQLERGEEHDLDLRRYSA